MQTFKQAISQFQRIQLEKLTQEKITYNKTLVEVEIAGLKRPSYSSRVIIDNRLSVLQDNLTQFGFLGGIFIHEQTKHVIDGWHRLELWQDLGNHTIPCYLIQCDATQERELHLRLNHQIAAFDLSSFGLEFQQFDLLNYGFTQDELFSSLSDTTPYLNFQKKAVQNGYVKLQALVTKEAYLRLKARKSEFGVKSIQDVIEHLA